MDEKAKDILKKYYEILINNTFIESDVLGILIFIREYISKDSPLREICDFIAHRRKKDRGSTVEYLHRLKEYMLTENKLPSDIIYAHGLYKDFEIIRDFNKFLAENDYLPLSNNILKDFILCIISILQEVNLEYNKKVIGKLYVTVDSISIGIYVDLDASSAFTIYDAEGKSDHVVLLATPIIKLFFLPQKTSEYCYQFKDKPLNLFRREGKLTFKFN